MAVKNALRNIEYVFNLRTLLHGSIKDLPQDVKRSLSSFLDVVLVNNNIDFTDIKKRGAYDGLLLGSENPDLFNEFMGIQPKGFIKDDSPYLIEVERTFRDSTIMFEFFGQDSRLSEKKQNILIRLFKEYNSDIDIEKFIGIAKLPALVIKDFNLSFLNEPDEDIKILLGENLVQKIRIGIPSLSNTTLYSPIRSLHIITPSFSGLHDLNKDIIQNLFGKNLSTYNFIFLNDENDFLVKLFFDAIAQFEETHGLKNLLHGLHKSLFFVKDEKFLSSTRLFNEHREYQRFLKTKYENDLKYKKQVYFCITILNFLNFICLKIKNRLANDVTPAIKCEKSIKIICDEFKETIKNDNKQLLPLFQKLNKDLSTLDTSHNNDDGQPHKKNRETFFDEYESCLSSFLYFIKKYSPSRENDIEDCIRENVAAKKSYIEKKAKFFFKKTYIKEDQDFNNFIESKIKFLTLFIKDVPDSIQTESVNLFFKELDRQYVAIQKTAEFFKTDLLLSRLENIITQELIRLMNSNFGKMGARV